MIKTLPILMTLLITFTYINDTKANNTDINCETVDLSDRPPFNTTPYNQAGTSWCASYTAADMISYHENNRLGTNIAASPTALAFEAWHKYRDLSNPNAIRELSSRKETNEITDIQSVQIDEALSTIINNGICSQDKVPVRFSTSAGEFLRTKSALDQLYRYYISQSNNLTI